MKKMLLFAAVSAIALTGCVNEDFNYEQPENQPQLMRFDAPVMKQTRANIIGEISGVKYPAAENFIVFCKSYTGSFKGWTNSDDVTDYFNSKGDTVRNESYMTPELVDSKYWVTDSAYIWPAKSYNLAFAAYSPAKLTTEPTSIAHTEKGLQITGFHTEEDANEQYDLMYTSRKYDMNSLTNGNASVPLVFHHALSSIVFSSQKSDINAEYHIDSVKINGDFIQTADFDQNIDETSNLAEGDAMWSFNPASASNITYKPNFPSFNVPSAAPAQFTSGTSALLLIPQDVPDNATVTVYYKMNGMEAEETIELKKFTYDNGGTLTTINTWEKGIRYVYRIAFGKNERIYFEPSVTDWVQHTTLIYTINNVSN